MGLLLIRLSGAKEQRQFANAEANTTMKELARHNRAEERILAEKSDERTLRNRPDSLQKDFLSLWRSKLEAL